MGGGLWGKVKITKRNELRWRGRGLHLGNASKPLAIIVPDRVHRGMWRVLVGGSLSDMANLTRARDAAMVIALSDLNHQETHLAAPPMRFTEEDEVA